MSDKSPELLELEQKVSGLKQLLNVHDLVMTGQFPGHVNKRIAEAISFIESLHKQLLTECQNHPEADKIPGLLFKGESHE